MVKRDPKDKSFGTSEPQSQLDTGRPETVGDDELLAEVQAKPGIIDNIRDRLSKQRHYVELENGDAVTLSQANSFASEMENLIGAQFSRIAQVSQDGRTHKEPYDPRKHPEGTPTKTRMVEFISANTQKPGYVTPTGQSIWMITNGGTPVEIGRTLAKSALERMRDRGYLATGGEEMLAEMSVPSDTVSLTEATI